MAISLAEAERRLNQGGDISEITASQWRQLEQIEEQNRIAAQNQRLLTQPVNDPGRFSTDNIPSGFTPANYPSPDTTPADTGPSAQDLYYQNLERQAREGARSFLRGLLEQYGLGSLAGRVEELVGETTNELVIAERLRQTDEYKQRFKGLIGLQQRGIPDIRNEAEYLNLESQYRQVFREAGLRDYLGQSGTQSEYDAIAKIVGDFSLSVNEVRDRVTDAQRVVAETPQEVRDSLQRFYNIDPATLTQFVLDPENTTSEIQRRANAAIVGGYAQRAGLTFGAGVSERIGEFVGGGEDVRGTAIEPLLTEVSDIQKATRRLADIEKTTLTEEETALSRLDLDQEAREKVRGLQSRERARFSGRSAIKSAALKRPRSI